MMCILEKDNVQVTISVKEKQNKVDLGLRNSTNKVQVLHAEPCCKQETLLDVYQFWKDYFLNRKYELKVEEV